MGDFDKMVTMLTPGFGKIGCAAKGARRPKSLLLAGSQFLCFGEYLLYKGSGSYHINSCETIELFYSLRTDLEKLSYASHITRIVSDVTDENQNTYKILQLFLNTLYMMSQTNANLELITSIFELRLLCILGFSPHIKDCKGCKNHETGYFSIKDNGFKCKECAKLDTSCIAIGKATVNAIQYIVLAPAKKLFSFHLSGEGIKELSLIAKLYTNEKLEKEYRLDPIF